MDLRVWDTMDEARIAALNQSRKNPSQYVTIQTAFGLIISVENSLRVSAPSNSVGGTYWHRGIELPFSKKQLLKDQNSGLTKD